MQCLATTTEWSKTMNLTADSIHLPYSNPTDVLNQLDHQRKPHRGSFYQCETLGLDFFNHESLFSLLYLLQVVSMKTSSMRYPIKTCELSDLSAITIECFVPICYFSNCTAVSFSTVLKKPMNLLLIEKPDCFLFNSVFS
jgi:hypothetical protein